MLYAQFLRWAGKWALGKQKYLNKVWQEATKGGKQVLESHFPKLLNKAKDYYNEFKGFTPKVVPKTKITPDKVTKIPTKFKTPPVQPKRYPIFANPTSQEAMIFFREYGKKQQGIYGPFGKGTDGFRNMMQWVGVNSPKEVMKVMKQYGYKPKVVPPGKAEGGIAGLEKGGSAMPSDMDYPQWFNFLQGPKTEEWPVDPALLASAPEGELFMMEEFLQAVKDGFKGTYDEYIDQIDRSPRDYLQEGGSPHFSKRGPRYEIDTSFGGVDSKYYSASIPEGIEMLKGDIKDLARKYWRSAKMKEGEWGKFPPLPISLAGLVSLIPAMRLLKPIKGLYELEKKTGGLGVSMFKTIAGDKSRRAFLQNMIGNTKRFKDAQLKEMFKKAAEAGKRKASKFKWEPTGPGSKFYNKLQEILAKHSTKHAKGGRIGFDEGGSTQKEIDKALVAIEKLKPGLMPESYKALIELYKDKQKDLNIDIMESAGGLGEMLGEGGRIGMAGGMSAKRIDSKKRDNYFRFNRDNYMNLFEYLQSEQAERDLEGAFKKGGKVKKGGIGDLMGGLYRLFEIGPLLGSPELMNIIQNLPFEKGGRVGFKKGQKVDLDRRMILKGIASLAALPMFKWLKLGKPLKDITVKIRKASWNEDVDYGTSGNVLFDFIGKSKVGRELIKKYLPKNYKKDWGMDPKDAYKIVKKAKDKGLNIKVTELADDATTVVKDGVVNPKWYLGGRTLDRQTQQRLYNEAQKRFKKQTSRENIKEHLADTQFFENDMYKWPKPNYTGTPTRYTDKIIDLIEPVVKKAGGGPVGFPPVQFNPEQQPPFQGPPYETNRPKDAGKEILRRYLGSGIAGAPLPGGFSLDMPYGTNKEFDIGIGYGTDPRASDFSIGYGVNLEGDDIMGASYQGDNFDIGVKKREGSDPTFGFTWKKKFDQGGIARRPNAVPPLSGPTPQGLTFLLGDDIVKNRIT